MCRTRRTKDGKPSKRKGWFRSAASKARFSRAMKNKKKKK